MRHLTDGGWHREHLEQWLAERPDAADLAATAARLRAAAGGVGGLPSDEALVASYLAPGPRDHRALRRLLDDPALRREVAAVARLTDPMEEPETAAWRRQRRPRYWVAAALVASAASLVGVVTLPHTSPAPAHRATPIVGAEIHVITPGGERSAPPEVEWEVVLSADLYELEVTAADGRPVFSAQTMHTTLRIPDGVVEPGVTYFFRVRARLEVGRWITSDFREFAVRP